ncbi:MAG TPA: ferredoxin family protein [Phycisphaerae bacterium]|nr:ferredoxin family protein [Phycisphaerae bacterium]
MAYVVTDACTKCMSCPPVCPVSCIHPAEGEEGLDAVSHVNIHPAECIDCGACAGVCPAEAIFPESDLPDEQRKFAAENAAYFKS